MLLLLLHLLLLPFYESASGPSLMSFSISAAQFSVGNLGLYLRTGTPFWLMRNFSKFQMMSVLRSGLQMTLPIFAVIMSEPVPATSS